MWPPQIYPPLTSYKVFYDDLNHETPKQTASIIQYCNLRANNATNLQLKTELLQVPSEA